MDPLETKVSGYGAGDHEIFTGEQTGAVALLSAHKLDSPQSREELRKLQGWYYHERDAQAENRMEMATDANCYDNEQWTPEDAAEVEARGQVPLVYNEVAPMCDWLIGTERRQRADWKVLPRTEDDVKTADVKTKVLKFVSDINRVTFNRSRAFADAIKSGVGWLDDGARDDPTQDVLYSKYEDWRNVLWDSASYEPDLSDARYVFRWRWVDEDIAIMMFPDRADAIRRACSEGLAGSHAVQDDEFWRSANESTTLRSGQFIAAGVGLAVNATRRRVKLIECQYRKPAKSKVIGSGPLKGAFFDERDTVLMDALQKNGGSIVDRVMMRMHVAVFTDGDLLSMNPSIYRHNAFTLTPIFCYRRGRDRMPYGVIRRVRDMQMDLNKRASKALFMLSTNQIIADDDATEDWDELRDEADRPDGIIKRKRGTNLEIRRDTDAATGQIQMMTLDAQAIQKSAGVAQENMGRQSNAVSGEAIKARQTQGSVVTTEPFDNLRLATQVQGEKQLSHTEQFYTEQKVIRLTGSKGKLDWVKINQPEQQPDGSVRYINDITASMADFVVSEQDYSGTLRQVMFESMNQLANRLPPEVSLRIMTIAMEFSDLPNHDLIAEEFRKLTGERDPNKEMTPEEAQQQQEQQAMQAEAMQLQRETAMTALDEARAKVREINARAEKLESEARGATGEEGVSRALIQAKEAAATEVEAMSKQLADLQAKLSNQTMQIRSDADTATEVARINADKDLRVAEIQAGSDKKFDAIEQQLTRLAQTIQDQKTTSQAAAPAPAPTPAPAPAAPPAPMTINVTVDGASGDVQKSIVVERDAEGNLIGAQVKPVKGKTKQ
jgi:hypothetical protein